MSFTCSACGAEAPGRIGSKEFRAVPGPCRACGKEAGITGHVTFSETVGVSATMSAVARNATTSRSTPAVDTERPEVNDSFNEVQRFVDMLIGLSDSDEIVTVGLASPVGAKVQAELAARVDVGLRGEYFRGRWLRRDEVLPESFRRPPSEKVKEPGRYNRGGDPVLYLARDVPTVLDEIGRVHAEERSLFVQRFVLDLPELRLVRLSPDVELPGSVLNQVMFFAERVPDNPSAAGVYRPTLFLRALAEELRVQALEFPSVRGGFPANANAVNLVVFGEAARMVEEQMDGEPEQAG